MKILVYGYGNPGRQDDGLGPVMIEKINEWIEQQGIQHVSTDCNYQLNIEDAERISNFDRVVFVDASIESINNFSLSKVEPGKNLVEFTMHAVSPAYVLDLCNKIFNKTPEAYLVHIQGYEFELVEELTPNAKKNLEQAFKFLTNPSGLLMQQAV